MERADSFEAHTGSLRNWFGVMARPYVGECFFHELRGWPCINLEAVAEAGRSSAPSRAASRRSPHTQRD